MGEKLAISSSRSLDRIQAAAETADRILSELPDEALWPDDMVINLRTRARDIGRQAWRIECACDAELMNRTHARRGRGNIDSEQNGVRAAVRDIADRLQITPKTVFLNAQIHRTFCDALENGHIDVTILSEKTFYIVALSANDPIAALEQFTVAKQKDPDFSVRDARRLIRQSRRPVVTMQPIEAIKELQGQVNKEFLEKVIKSLRSLVDECPSPPVATQMNRWLSWLTQQKERTPEKDWQRIVAAMQVGCYTVEDIADETGMEESEVKDYLAPRVAAGQLKVEKKGGKTDGARGASSTLYCLPEEFEG